MSDEIIVKRCETCDGWRKHKKGIGYCLVHAAFIRDWKGDKKTVSPLTRYDDVCTLWEEKEAEHAKETTP